MSVYDPETWYRSLPRITKVWFTASALTSLLLCVYPASWEFVSLDWSSSLLTHPWRLTSSFLVFGYVTASLWQIGLMGVYSRQFELDNFNSARGRVEYLLLLALGASLTLGCSYSLFTDLRYGGPVLLFFVITLHSRVDLYSPASITPYFVFTRQWLPLLHVFLLYLVGSHWQSALWGCIMGYLVWAAATKTSLATRLKSGKALPEAIYQLGPLLCLGDPAWYASRPAGVRLGEAEAEAEGQGAAPSASARAR